MNNSRVNIYEDKEGDTELDIHVSYEEMYNAVKKTDWYKELDEVSKGQFVSVCDWCGEVDSEYHYFPELGHKVSCKRCAKEHRKIVKWYTEDLHYIFNSLIMWVLTYDIGWSENDYRMIDEFFASKGHNEIHIKKFIEQYKKDVK